MVLILYRLVDYAGVLLRMIYLTITKLSYDIPRHLSLHSRDSDKRLNTKLNKYVLCIKFILS